MKSLSYRAGYLTGYMDKQAQAGEQPLMDATTGKPVGKFVPGYVNPGIPASQAKTRFTGTELGWGAGMQPEPEEDKAARMKNLQNRAVINAPRLVQPADTSKASSGLPLADMLKDPKMLLTGK
jgi:hypothetical protein